MALLVLALWAGAAHGQVIDITWTTDGHYTHRREIPAGQFVEICGPLAAGTKVRWSFDATGPTDFNIHYHQGKEVVYPARLAQAKHGSQTLPVAVGQDYCWMWRNTSSDTVTMNLSLAR